MALKSIGHLNAKCFVVSLFIGMVYVSLLSWMKLHDYMTEVQAFCHAGSSFTYSLLSEWRFTPYANRGGIRVQILPDIAAREVQSLQVVAKSNQS